MRTVIQGQGAVDEYRDERSGPYSVSLYGDSGVTELMSTVMSCND
jgi:hypothetical protein